MGDLQKDLEFVQGLERASDAVMNEVQEEHFKNGLPLVIERDGVTMLEHADGGTTPLDGE